MSLKLAAFGSDPADTLAAAIAPRSTPVCPPETIFDTSIYIPSSSAADLPRYSPDISFCSSARMRSASGSSFCATAYSSNASNRLISSILSSLCGITIRHSYSTDCCCLLDFLFASKLTLTVSHRLYHKGLASPYANGSTAQKYTLSVRRSNPENAV